MIQYVFFPEKSPFPYKYTIDQLNSIYSIAFDPCFSLSISNWTRLT